MLSIARPPAGTKRFENVFFSFILGFYKTVSVKTFYQRFSNVLIKTWFLCKRPFNVLKTLVLKRFTFVLLKRSKNVFWELNENGLLITFLKRFNNVVLKLSKKLIFELLSIQHYFWSCRIKNVSFMRPFSFKRWYCNMLCAARATTPTPLFSPHYRKEWCRSSVSNLKSFQSSNSKLETKQEKVLGEGRHVSILCAACIF